MASHASAVSLGFKAAAAISRGMAVKAGADNKHVDKATAGTDKIIGLAMNTVTAAEDTIDVALPGGGAVGLLGDTVAFGDLLTADSGGKLVATTTANDRVVAIAMDAGAVNDLISVHVVVSNH